MKRKKNRRRRKKKRCCRKQKGSGLINLNLNDAVQKLIDGFHVDISNTKLRNARKAELHKRNSTILRLLREVKKLRGRKK